jgi:excisionase family DNA binding protein
MTGIQVDVNRRYPIPVACELLYISRARLYEKIARGEIVATKDGRRTFIPGSEIARLSRA